MTTPVNWVFDPQANLPFGFNWADWLANENNDTIASFQVTAPADVILGTDTKAPTESDGVVIFWITAATAGVHNITCRITTSQGRTDERTKRLTVRDR